MAQQFSGFRVNPAERARAKARNPGLGFRINQAEVDTVGMDPEMQKTLLGMQGAVGAGGSGGGPGPFDKVVNFGRQLGKSIFGPKKAAK